MADELEKLSTKIILVLPGFVSLILAQYIANISEIGEFQFFYLSLGFTFVNLSIAYVMYKIWRGLKNRLLRGTERKPAGSAVLILVLLVVSLSTGLAAGNVYESDTLLRWLRKLPITRSLTKRSYQRPLTFLLAQNRRGQLEEGRPKGLKTPEAWLAIYMTDGEVFDGQAEFFSLGPEPGEVFLSPACRRVSGGGRIKTEEIKGPGVLIFEKDIKFIEFLDKSKSTCHNLWKSIEEKALEAGP